MKNIQHKRIGMLSGFPDNESDYPDNLDFGNGLSDLLEDETSESSDNIPAVGTNPEEDPELPDVETVPETPGEEDEYELVKDKPKRKRNRKQRKLLRMALLFFAVIIVYRLLFGRR